MKKSIVISIMLLLCFAITQVYAEYAPAGSSANATSANQLNSSQSQTMQGQGYSYSEGGNASSNSDSIAVSGDSGAIANISTNSTSNYESRTPPVSMFPPYLPTFSHGGWGTIQGYFPNGPNGNDSMYERAFYPDSKRDMKELKGVMNSLPYDGPFSLIGGIFNGLGSLFGGPDNFHHGKGFEISNSIVRTRRPKDRPLYILIDSNINREYLNSTGYVYVGKLSLEGKVERNWDLVYKAAIAEALPWDVDIMLISGGMKGVTVGTNTTFPGVAGAYSQLNYSVSLLGGQAKGITEGKGMAMVSAECYRYYPAAAQSRVIPEAFYNKIHAKNVSTQINVTTPKIESLPKVEVFQETKTTKTPEPIQQVKTTPTKPTNVKPSVPIENCPVIESKPTAAKYVEPSSQPVCREQRPYKGVHVSQELYEMAGFDDDQQDYSNIR